MRARGAEASSCSWQAVGGRGIEEGRVIRSACFFWDFAPSTAYVGFCRLDRLPVWKRPLGQGDGHPFQDGMFCPALESWRERTLPIPNGSVCQPGTAGP